MSFLRHSGSALRWFFRRIVDGSNAATEHLLESSESIAFDPCEISPEIIIYFGLTLRCLFVMLMPIQQMLTKTLQSSLSYLNEVVDILVGLITAEIISFLISFMKI